MPGRPGRRGASPASTRTLIDDYLRQPPSQPARTPPHLTGRERDILDGICRGLSNRQIAAELFVGQAAVKTYASRLLQKFATDSRVGRSSRRASAGCWQRDEG